MDFPKIGGVEFGRICRKTADSGGSSYEVAIEGLLKTGPSSALECLSLYNVYRIALSR